MSGGSAVLASVSVIWIAAQARWTFGLADGLFWGSVVAFVVLRAVATRLTRNAHGPQAASAWARTALVVGAAAVALWLGAKSIQSRTIEANAHDYSSGGAQRV